MKKKSIFIILLIVFGIFIALIISKRLMLWIGPENISKYSQYPSLLPEIRRTTAVRFDPSFYYEGKRPRELAKELARRWQNAGINLVFYRAYDPRFGAFYRTKYQHNKEGEFGKYNLLKHVLKECHARNLRVFAWLSVMNHSGGWHAHPEWRAKTAEGKDYSDIGLEFPLCGRITEARTWWYNFVVDLLTNYPEIDGIDFAEPVVSWRKGDACYCEKCREDFETLSQEMSLNEIRAQPLTMLLKESIAIAHRSRKEASVTFVVTADPSGKIYNLEQISERTGFDLTGLLYAKKKEIPDIICPEFLWQEWKSRYLSLKTSPQTFSPEWTMHAFRSFLQCIDSPVEIIAHVELTDYPGVEVNREAFRKTLWAVIEGGASGIDIYSSRELENKQAWRELKSVEKMVRKKQCMVLYDPQSDQNDAVQIGELLRHFQTEVSLRSLDKYVSGTIHNFDNTFYVGTEMGTTIPAALLNDLHTLSKSFCWLGFNIEAPLSVKSLSDKLGLQFLTTVRDKFHHVSYKNMTLKKEDPWTNVVKVIKKERCRILATASDGKQQIPYSVQCGRNFWYFADIPSSYAIEGGRFLVFADLLHDILDEDHIENHLALVRIEDVHPLTDPESLKEIADYLYGEGIPFQVAFIPTYVYPEENTYVSMSEKPEFIDALQHMVKKGATLVMHGITHQRFTESTTDYEFWDPISDSPVKGQTRSEIRQRIESGLRDCWSNDIYPLIWETPHYAGSQEFYSEISNIFTLSMERRQAIEKSKTDQYLPYAIFPDRFGQIILPENLGFVPLDNQKAEVIIEPAKNMKVVRDGVAGFFFHPFVDMDVLKKIVQTLKKERFRFTNAAGLPIRVKTSFGLVTNFSGEIDFFTKNFSGHEKHLVFPGIVRSKQDIVADPQGKFHKKLDLREGEIYAVQFISPYEEARLKRREKEDLEELKAVQVLQNVSNDFGERCKVPVPLMIASDKTNRKSDNEARSFESIFALVGIDLLKIDVSEFAKVPPGVNIIILPFASAVLLNDSQIEIIMDALRKGGISLITSGFTTLSDEIGIEKTDASIQVHSVIDKYYPDVEIEWERPVESPVFDSPSDASFIYVESEYKIPLVVASSFEKGKYIFLGLPLNEDSPVGSKRFPHFLTHIFYHLRFYPLIRGANAEVFFNPSEREEVAIENLVKLWRRSGVRIIYVAGWHFFPEWNYDYERLIHLAHTNAMLVYAWIEPPYVNEKFWQEHPEWREKNALGKDAIVSWRKPIALGSSKALNAALKEWRMLLENFNWDGVIINRLGFESRDSVKSPETYTPFHPSVREQFKTESGFDPLELLNPSSPNYWKKNHKGFHRFKEFRSSLARRYVESLLSVISEIRTTHKTSWEIILAYDARRKDSGLELAELRNLKQKFYAKLQLIPKIEDQWEIPIEKFDLIQLSISLSRDGSTFHPLAPTQYPTGTALYNLMRRFIKNSQRYSLFSESSFYEIDTRMLPFLLASRSSVHWSDEGLFVQTPHSGEIVFSDETLENLSIDGLPAGSFYLRRLVLPVGEHYIAPLIGNRGAFSALKSNTRLVDCSCDLLKSEINLRGITVFYRSDKQAILVINEKPLAAYLDGTRIKISPEKGLRGWAIMLPQGEHSVKVVTLSFGNLILTSLSLVISNAIIAISAIAISVLILLFVIYRIRSRLRS